MNSQSAILEQIIHCIKKYHYIENFETQKIGLAFKLLQTSLHDRFPGATSHNVEDSRMFYVNHSLSVAKHVASWRFDYTVVIASLLHVLPTNNIKPLEEIKPLIDEEAYKILKGYVEIHQQIESLKAKDSIEDHCHEYLHCPHPESFYIEIASHIEYLSHNLGSTNEEVLSFAQKTREILIPQVKYIHAYKMVDFLEELCFKIENRSVYEQIEMIFLRIDDLNEFSRQQFITKLNRIFDTNSNIIPANLKKTQFYIKELYSNKRSIASVYRFVTQNDQPQYTSTLQLDLSKLHNIARTAFYDLTLVLKDQAELELGCSLIDIFMKYYETMLQPIGVFMYGFHQTTSRDSCYFLLSDPAKNMYRFFVKSEEQYLYFLYGDIIIREKLNLNYSSSENEATIKVFKRDGTAEFVRKGTTALDFAFKIHEDLGLHFGGAILNQNGRVLPAYTTLGNGDSIEIRKSPNITAELNWFRYVKTDLAINHLIKHFKAQYAQSGSEIKVFSKDGSYTTIQEGATVLDFAFMVHKDLGLCFDYALINGKKTHYPVDHVLCNGDTVVIKKSPLIRAEYYWFRHAKTAKATNYLIEYFKHAQPTDK